MERVFFIGRNGHWFEGVQVCFSDTCACNNHDRYEKYPVTRGEVKSALEKGEAGPFSDEEMANLNDTSLDTLVSERFHLLGLSWGEVEEWVRVCYAFGVNPLPALRRELEGVCKVAFAYADAGYYAGRPTLVCWLDETDNRMTVRLEAFEGEEEDHPSSSPDSPDIPPIPLSEIEERVELARPL